MKIEEEILKIQKKLIEIDIHLGQLNEQVQTPPDIESIKQKKESDAEFDLNRVAEKAYKRTFWLMVFVVLGASVGNSMARWILGDPNLELIPKTVFEFIKDVAYIFVIPVSIKIVGDKLPMVIEMLKNAGSLSSELKKQMDDKSKN